MTAEITLHTAYTGHSDFILKKSGAFPLSPSLPSLIPLLFKKKTTGK